MLHFREALIGQDPTDVERVMLRIRRRGAFKPHGAAVSMIEVALWDIAGKAAGLPIYKLLGGKVRDRVRVYNGAIRTEMTGTEPEDYAAAVKTMMELPQGFQLREDGRGVPLEDEAPRRVPLRRQPRGQPVPHGFTESSLMTERGMAHLIDCVAAMKDVLGDRVGLALDCGPGFTVPDAIRFARACEPFNLMWLEDMVTGDYTPYVNADVYADVTRSTTTPIHTGEQIYLRQNFKDLIERQRGQRDRPGPVGHGWNCGVEVGRRVRRPCTAS